MAELLPGGSGAWALDEVRATIDAYFQFWLGDPGDWETKMDVYRTLHAQFPDRSAKAFEFKFQNVSGALYLDGLSFMPGLLPRVNAQKLLVEEVRVYLAQNPEIRAAVGPLPPEFERLAGQSR